MSVIQRCGVRATFEGKIRRCIIETDNPNHDMPGPNGGSTGHWDGEFHWVQPSFGFIGPEPPPTPKPKPPLCPDCGSEVSAYMEDGGYNEAWCDNRDCEWEYIF